MAKSSANAIQFFFERIANQPCTSIQEWNVDEAGKGKKDNLQAEAKDESSPRRSSTNNSSSNT